MLSILVGQHERLIILPFSYDLFSPFICIISERCLQSGRYPSLYHGDGFAVTDIDAAKLNYGCVNECVPTKNEVYVIAQVASGNLNNDLVIPSLRIDN